MIKISFASSELVQRQIARWKRAGATSLIGASIVCTCCALAGCSSRGTGPRAQISPANCGSVTAFGNGEPPLNQTTRAPLSCFADAARSCSNSSINLTDMEVDTGVHRVFRLYPYHGVCRATETSRGYTANFGGRLFGVTITPCPTLKVTTTGVSISCGSDQFTLPAPTNAERH
jgi:hypothetical protein